MHREFQEEIGQALTRVRPAGVLENIFQWDAATQHEIVFVFTAAFADDAAYEIHEQRVLDAPEATRVLWRMPGATVPLYPVGVAEIAMQGRGS